MPRRTLRDLPATYGLLAAIALMYVLEGGLGGQPTTLRMVTLGAQVNALVLEGQWWRLLTAMFLHLSWEHIGLNGWSLFVMGELVEPAFGTRRFLAIYLLGGLMGGLVSLVAYPALGVLVGASGAIFGLLGATGVIALRSRGPLRAYLVRWLGSILVLNLAFDFMVPGIGVWDHVGGLVGGFLAAVALTGNTWGRHRWGRVAGIAYVVASGALVRLAMGLWGA